MRMVSRGGVRCHWSLFAPFLPKSGTTKMEAHEPAAASRAAYLHIRRVQTPHSGSCWIRLHSGDADCPPCAVLRLRAYLAVSRSHSRKGCNSKFALCGWPMSSRAPLRAPYSRTGHAAIALRNLSSRSSTSSVMPARHGSASIMRSATARRSSRVVGRYTLLPGPAQQVELMGQTLAACASAM